MQRVRRRAGASRSEAPTHLVGLLADTEHLTVTTGRVYAGHVEDPRKVEDESLLVVTAGELWVDVQEQDGDRYATDCLLPGDAMYVPAHSTDARALALRPALDLPHGVRSAGRSRLGSLASSASQQSSADQARLRPGHRRLHRGRVRAVQQARQQLGDQQRRARCPTYRARRRAR